MRQLLVIVLALLSSAAIAGPPGPPPGPPVEQIAAQMGLSTTQTAEVKRILGEAHARIQAAAKESIEQADAELANVLTIDQLSQFKQLMEASRPHGPRPSPPPSTAQ